MQLSAKVFIVYVCIDTIFSEETNYIGLYNRILK